MTLSLQKKKKIRPQPRCPNKPQKKRPTFKKNKQIKNKIKTTTTTIDKERRAFMLSVSSLHFPLGASRCRITQTNQRGLADDGGAHAARGVGTHVCRRAAISHGPAHANDDVCERWARMRIRCEHEKFRALIAHPTVAPLPCI